MLWRMSADSRARRLGVMSTYRTGKARGEPPSRPAAGRHQPVPRTDGARGPIAPSRQFPDPYYGAKEFPVAYGPSRAISCRFVSGADRSADRRLPITLAETAQPPGRAGQAADLFSRHRLGFGQ